MAFGLPVAEKVEKRKRSTPETFPVTGRGLISELINGGRLYRPGNKCSLDFTE